MQCSETNPEEMSSAFISGASWRDTAQFILDEYEANYWQETLKNV